MHQGKREHYDEMGDAGCSYCWHDYTNVRFSEIGCLDGEYSQETCIPQEAR
jgi:hypothetical protein